MSRKDQQFSDHEQLKAENEYLKLKLMLENGARFEGSPSTDGELPPELENQFLKNMIEFERRWEEHKTIRVFDKIGKPSHFRKVMEIPDNEINQAWDELIFYLQQYNISLDVCSPNISKRELYRFATEELFELETDDMNMPGWITGFIYDEFYPDQVYENTRAATEYCILRLLDKQPLESMYHFRHENIRLNDYYPLTPEEIKKHVNSFKAAYDDLAEPDIQDIDCIINEKISRVTGTYKVKAVIGKDIHELSGKWQVGLGQDEKSGYWYIDQINIEGIKF